MTLNIPIIVLNLSKNTTKMRNMKLQFPSCIRLNAVDGTELNNHPKTSICPNNVLGCGLSHRAAWKYIVNNKLSKCIILEDDIIKFDKFDDNIEKCLHNLPSDWDLVLLGYQGACDYSQDYSAWQKLFLAFFLMKKREHKQISSDLFVPEKPHGAFGYMVSNKGAKTLLKNIQNVYWHIDIMMYNIESLQLFAINPPLVLHNYNNDSNLGTKGILSEHCCHIILDKNNTHLKHILEEGLCQINGFVVNLEHIIFCILFIIYCVYRFRSHSIG